MTEDGAIRTTNHLVLTNHFATNTDENLQAETGRLPTGFPALVARG